MIVGQDMTLRYRSTVQFRSARERRDITRYVQDISNRAHVFQNPNYPWPPQAPNVKYGVLNVDFDSACARDEFDQLVASNHFQQKGVTPRIIKMKSSDMDVPIYDPVVEAPVEPVEDSVIVVEFGQKAA